MPAEFREFLEPDPHNTLANIQHQVYALRERLYPGAHLYEDRDVPTELIPTYKVTVQTSLEVEVARILRPRNAIVEIIHNLPAEKTPGDDISPLPTITESLKNRGATRWVNALTVASMGLGLMMLLNGLSLSYKDQETAAIIFASIGTGFATSGMVLVGLRERTSNFLATNKRFQFLFNNTNT